MALKKAKEKLNKAHAKFLKSTLGAKTYAGFSAGKDSSKDASKIAKAKKPKKVKEAPVEMPMSQEQQALDAQYQSPAESADAAPTQEAAIQQDPSTAVAAVSMDQTSPAPEPSKTDSSSVAPSASPEAQDAQPMQLDQPPE